MHHPTDRITHTTAFVAPVVEHWLKREIVQWVGVCYKVDRILGKYKYNTQILHIQSGNLNRKPAHHINIYIF